MEKMQWHQKKKDFVGKWFKLKSNNNNIINKYIFKFNLKLFIVFSRYLISIHCVAHRLVLGICDLIKESDRK